MHLYLFVDAALPPKIRAFGTAQLSSLAAVLAATALTSLWNVVTGNEGPGAGDSPLENQFVAFTLAQLAMFHAIFVKNAFMEQRITCTNVVNVLVTTYS